jgi:hypothetical protein
VAAAARSAGAAAARGRPAAPPAAARAAAADLPRDAESPDEEDPAPAISTEAAPAEAPATEETPLVLVAQATDAGESPEAVDGEAEASILPRLQNSEEP